MEYSLKYQESFSNESQPPTCQQGMGLNKERVQGLYVVGMGLGLGLNSMWLGEVRSQVNKFEQVHGGRGSPCGRQMEGVQAKKF